MITITTEPNVSEAQLKTVEDILAGEFATRGWLSDRERQRRRIAGLINANNEEVTKRRAAEITLEDKVKQNEALQVALTESNRVGSFGLSQSLFELRQAKQDLLAVNEKQATEIRELLQSTTKVGFLHDHLKQVRKERDELQRVLGCVRQERDAYVVQRNTLVGEVDQLKRNIWFLEQQKISTVDDVRPDILKDLRDELDNEKRHCETARTALKTRTAERDKLQSILDNPYSTVGELHKRTEAAEKLVGEQAAKIVAFERQVFQMERDCKIVRESYNKLAPEREFLKKQIDQQVTVITELQGRNDNQYETILDHKAMITFWEGVHKTEADQILSLNARIDELKRRDEGTASQLTELGNEVLKLRKQLEIANKKCTLVEQACDVLGYKVSVKVNEDPTDAIADRAFIGTFSINDRNGK